MLRSQNWTTNRRPSRQGSFNWRHKSPRKRSECSHTWQGTLVRLLPWVPWIECVFCRFSCQERWYWFQTWRSSEHLHLSINSDGLQNVLHLPATTYEQTFSLQSLNLFAMDRLRCLQFQQCHRSLHPSQQCPQIRRSQGHSNISHPISRYDCNLIRQESIVRWFAWRRWPLCWRKHHQRVPPIRKRLQDLQPWPGPFTWRLLSKMCRWSVNW